MIKHGLVFLIFIGIIGFGSSCSPAIQVDRQKGFSLESNRTKRIVSINPNFQPIAFKEQISTDDNKGITPKGVVQKKIAENQQAFNALLTENALKNGVHLDIVNTDELQDDDMSYFKYLAPLRKEIFKSNLMQNFKEINTKSDIQKQNNLITLYKNGIHISNSYGKLAEVYGTPYFALQGVLLKHKKDSSIPNEINSITPVEYPVTTSEDVETWYYTIIADVTKSQIVYREYRKVALNMSDTNMSSIIYDSFKIIAR